MSLPLFFRVFFVDLLRRVVVSLTVSFFVSFRVNSSDDKVRFDIVIRPNHIHQYVSYKAGILDILCIFGLSNVRIGLESIIFAINVCHPLNFLPFSIICLYQLYY